MPLAVPWTSSPPDMGGPFYGGADQSTMGSPITGIGRGVTVDPQLTGTVPVYGTQDGQTHIYVGTLVLLALGGLIAFHLLGFRFAGDVGVFTK